MTNIIIALAGGFIAGIGLTLLMQELKVWLDLALMSDEELQQLAKYQG